MKLRLIAVGTKMPAWVDQACNEYEKRVVAPVEFSIESVAAAKRGRNPVITRLTDEEGGRLLDMAGRDVLIIALDERGKRLNTRELAIQLQGWVDESRDVCLLIGGPDGLSDRVRQNADLSLRLSDFTLAHPVARVVLAEQVYRAYSIIRKLPYHRD